MIENFISLDEFFFPLSINSSSLYKVVNLEKLFYPSEMKEKLFKTLIFERIRKRKEFETLLTN